MHGKMAKTADPQNRTVRETLRNKLFIHAFCCYEDVGREIDMKVNYNTSGGYRCLFY